MTEPITEVFIALTDLTDAERDALELVAAGENLDITDYVVRRWTADGRAFTCTDTDTICLTPTGH